MARVTTKSELWQVFIKFAIIVGLFLAGSFLAHLEHTIGY